MGIIPIRAFKCERCNHVWLPRDMKGNINNLEAVMPKVCPNCKSPYWNTPRRTIKKIDTDRAA